MELTSINLDYTDADVRLIMQVGRLERRLTWERREIDKLRRRVAALEAALAEVRP